jgi:hypothetical protein|tara:strand:+ start:166 stop:552 length:387 start_codon:yes stop_codon:yes gene_type:complete
MITDTYKILKLISGENIICELAEENGKYEISRPLLMHVHPNITMAGMTESLMLSRWVQPFTEQTNFEIDPKHVIIMLPASPGLSVYYEGVLNKIEGGTERISLGDHINEDDIYDDLLEDLEPESKIIH